MFIVAGLTCSNKTTDVEIQRDDRGLASSQLQTNAENDR